MKKIRKMINWFYVLVLFYVVVILISVLLEYQVLMPLYLSLLLLVLLVQRIDNEYEKQKRKNSLIIESLELRCATYRAQLMPKHENSTTPNEGSAHVLHQ